MLENEGNLWKNEDMRPVQTELESTKELSHFVCFFFLFFCFFCFFVFLFFFIFLFLFFFFFFFFVLLNFSSLKKTGETCL